MLGITELLVLIGTLAFLAIIVILFTLVLRFIKSVESIATSLKKISEREK